MSDDLDARLGAALDALEASERGTRPHPAGLSVLHRDVRRRRAARTARRSGAAAVAALAVATVGWWGVRPVPQPATPPAPTPTAAQREDVTGLAVVTREGLPPLFEAPAGLLGRTGQGWTLITTGGAGAGEHRHGSVAVVAPDGTGYFLADLSAPVDLGTWSGGPTAVVTVDGADGPAGALATLDLTTGTVTLDVPGVEGLDGFVGTAADGSQVWTATAKDDGGVVLQVVRDDAVQVVGGPLRPGTHATISPDGRRVAFAEQGNGRRLLVLDLVTGVTTKVPVDLEQQVCGAAGWWAPTTVAAVCWNTLYARPGDAEQGVSRVVLVDVDGTSEPRVLDEISPGEPAPVSDVLVVGGEHVVVATTGGDEAGAVPHVWRSTGWAPMTDVDLGGRVLGVVPGAEGTVIAAVHTDDVLVDPDPDLVSIDVRTGEVQRLPSAPEQGAGTARFQDWVAARP